MFKKVINCVVITLLAMSHSLLADVVPTGFPNGIKTKYVNYNTATELTISSDTITVTQNIHTVDGEGDLSDDLSTINGGTTVNKITLYPANAARDITIKHGTGNILTSDGNDYTIPDNGIAILQYDGANWRLNPAGKISVPSSVTDRSIAVFNGTSGVSLIDTGVTVDTGQNIETVNSVKFDTSPVVPAYQEGLIYYDETNKSFVTTNEVSDVLLQVGQEIWARVYNNSGATINNGDIAYVSGIYNGFATIGEADASDSTKALSTIGVATHDIENTFYGYITLSGTVRDIDTTSCSSGCPLYLSTTPGEWTTTPPVSPNYKIRIGNCGVSDATNGTIYVGVQGDSNTQSVIEVFNGAVYEQPDWDVTSDGATVTGSLQKLGGGDLSLFFNGAFQILDCTPAATVTLTPGSDSVPQRNWVYIPQSTGVLTANTTGWPSEQIVPVACIMCPSESLVQTEGLYKNQVVIPQLVNQYNNGTLRAVECWIRNQHATYNSGVSYTFTPTIGAGTATTVHLSVTSGVVIQMYEETFPARNTATGDVIFVRNDSSVPYRSITGLVRASLTADSTGLTLANRYYNLVIWGVIAENTGDSHLFANLPSGSYGSDADAIADNSGYTITDIPAEYKGSGFLIAKVRLKDKSSDGTLEVLGITDLRGAIPGSTAIGGGGGAATTNYSDALFKIFNNTDNTKIASFSAGSISTGTTRTYTFPNSSGTFTLNSSTAELSNKIINADLNTIANISDSEISDTAAINATKIGNGDVTNAELSYVANVTSDVQTQLNAKQATITGAASTITSSDLGANYALKSNSLGKVAVSAVTATEQGYLSGVTSAIQTQFNNKQPLDSDLTAIAGLSNADSNFIVGNGSTWVVESGSTARTSLGAAESGANSSITSLSGLTTALSIPQGGTGQTTRQTAINALTGSATAVIGSYLGTDGSGNSIITGADAIRNTWVGGNSISMVSTAVENSAFGYQSMQFLATGDYNSCFGYNSGHLVSSGSYNTFIGHSSGGVYQSGSSNNTIIGYQAGIATSGDVEKSGMVCLGYQAGYNSTSDDNELWIDNSNTTTPLIWGDFDDDIIVVNGDIKATSEVYTDVIKEYTTSARIDFQSDLEISTARTLKLGGDLNIYDDNATPNLIVYLDQNNDRVGIGTSSPSYKLDVLGEVRINDGSNFGVLRDANGEAAIIYKASSGSDDGTVSIGSSGASAGNKYSYVSVNTNNAERTRVDSSGHIFFYALNTITGQSDVQYNTSTGELGYVSSSIKFKENVRDLESSDTSFIYDLRPKKYDRIDGSNTDEIGLIAEDVATINPKLACKDKDGNIVTYSRSDLIIPILYELQKAMDKIESLEKRIEKLENK